MSQPRLHVVAAVLRRGDTCLVQQRQAGKHMAGRWEFPGGKVENDETPWHGLVRELKEELGITASRGQRLIRLVHKYPDRTVDLDVWCVDAWDGDVVAQEKQITAWCNLDELAALPLLPADGPVIDALSLPHQILVTPGLSGPHGEFLAHVESAVRVHQLKLCILRQPQLAARDYATLAGSLGDVLHDLRCRLVVHGQPEERMGLCDHPNIVGVHVPSAHGMALKAIPDGLRSLSMSCHGRAELSHAAALGARFALLGSVQATESHPNGITLGWSGFQEHVARSNLPVYAIGGMAPHDEQRCRELGGQGIAAISAFWEGAF